MDAQIENTRLTDEGTALRRKLALAKRHARRHKLVIHGCLLVAIVVSLAVEGAKVGDLLFLALAVVTEVT